MAALDFPSSPTDGQVFNNWVYSTSKGAWKAKPLTPGQAQPSATAPTNPSNGDQWYNTNDGNLYIYYNDGNTSQWVQVKSDATLSSTLGTRVTSLETYPTGLVRLAPSSVTVANGSATISSTGLITFTSTSDISLNGIFSSTYERYKISFNIITATGEAGLNIRMKASGTASSASYYQAGLFSRTNGSSGVTNSITNGSNWGTGNSTTLTGDGRIQHDIELGHPGVTKSTNLLVRSSAQDATSPYQSHGAGFHDVKTAYDGIQFYQSTSTIYITGTIQVYGYRN